MLPFLLPFIAIIVTGAALLGLGTIFVAIGTLGTIIFGIILIIIVLSTGWYLGRNEGTFWKRLRLWILIFGGSTSATLVLLIGMFIVFKAAGHYSWTIDRIFRPAPEQPVEFPHPVHVQIAGMDCVFCHRTVEDSPMASVPAVEQCYFCHQVIGQQTGEFPAISGISKLNGLTGWDTTARAFVSGPKAIRWNRVHRLPDHVRFVHEAHINYFCRKGWSSSFSCVYVVS